ncbi:MAG: ComF family protein [Bryobacteraceae bacterium]|nr:ComF family protein [Bryobacteraceae bacterium]MDW8380032.1 ComF family protein [Bryobacterales bacterium]
MMKAFPPGFAIDVIVPVPMHWWRAWRRGFNQAELLAKEVSRRAGVRMCRAVRRKRWTPPQAGLSNRARRQNVSGLFEVTKPAEIRGLHVLLVDDVLTTGATASACASALKRAGARAVSVLTLARADRRVEPFPLPTPKTIAAASGGISNVES